MDTNIRVLAPALLKAGHRVSIVYQGPAGRNPADGNRSLDGCRILHSSYGNWHYYASRTMLGRTSLPRIIRGFERGIALKRLIRILRLNGGPELIEAPEILVTPFLLDRTPYTMRLHASNWMCQQMYAEPMDLAAKVEKRLEEYSLKRASGLSTPSTMVGDYIRHSCSLGTRAIDLIPYPVDTTVFAPGYSFRDSKILFVGRVENRKGADILMRAVPQVTRECPGVEFFFAGRVCDDVRALTATMPAHVHFLGVVPHRELAKWYQSAAICVVPSRWDNSPNTIYEAMACGTPVIASNVGGIPELVDDGVTGVLVPPADFERLAVAIVRLLSDRARREAMGQHARARAVARFHVDGIAARTLQFYSRVLN